MEQQKKQNLIIWLISGLIGIIALSGILYFSYEPKEKLEFGGLKAPKEKILQNQTIKVKKCSVKVETPTSTPEKAKCQTNIEEDIIKYDYITETKLTGEFLWSENDSFTNAEIISRNNKEIKAKFYSGDKFYKDAVGDIYEIEQGATTTPELFAEAIKPTFRNKLADFFFKNAFALSTTTYSGAGDGHVRSNTTYQTWDTAHDYTAGGYVNYVDADAQSAGDYISSGNYIIMRAFFPIDTSVLPTGAVISAATMNIRTKNAVGYAVGSPTFMVVQTTQASTTELFLEDFDQCGAVNNPTEGSDTVAPPGQNIYAVFTLNATGRSWINADDWTKLGVRESYDADDVAPGTQNTMEIYNSEQTGTASDPYLEITYTEAAAAEETPATEAIYIDEW